MKAHEIELLVDRLLGAFPATRVEPEKVKALWVRRPELLALDVEMAQILLDALVWKSYFPTLAEVLQAVADITTVHVANADCRSCLGVGYVHEVDAKGDPIRRPHPTNPDGPAIYVIAVPCGECS